MKYSLLGNTPFKISQIGLGTVKFGRNQGVKYPTQFELPTDKEILNLLACASDLGINLLDTAPAYGTSEERIGKLLKKQDYEWVLCTKVGEEFVNGQSHFDFSPAGTRSSIERSLRRLNVDALDIVLVHSNGDDKKIIHENEIFVTLSHLKKEGLIRSFGMSTKTIEGGMLAIDYSDVVMVTYNPTQVEEKPVISYAKEKNKGVLIKKALASGHIHQFSSENPIAMAMQFVFAEPGVSSVVLGTLNQDHLYDVVKGMKGARDLF